MTGNPVDARLYADYAAREQGYWWFTARRVIFHRLLATLGPLPTPEVLDIGPGSGIFTSELARYGRATAVELDAENAQLVRIRTGLPVIEASVTHMPVESGSVGLVVAGDVLEHVPDDLAAVREISRVLHRDGHVLLSVPAHPSLWSSHDVVAHHQRRYTETALRTVLATGGLEVDYLSPYNAALMAPIVAIRRFQRFRGRAHEPRSDFERPARPVNGALHAAFASEASLIARRMRLPFGVSFLVLARAA